jgi:hypothetical protein
VASEVYVMGSGSVTILEYLKKVWKSTKHPINLSSEILGGDEVDVGLQYSCVLWTCM